MVVCILNNPHDDAILHQYQLGVRVVGMQFRGELLPGLLHTVMHLDAENDVYMIVLFPLLPHGALLCRDQNDSRHVVCFTPNRSAWPCLTS